MAQDLENGEFAGADFRFLAANVADTSTGKTLFHPYGVKSFLGNKVAFIGMTLEGTPTIVTPSGVAGLTFSDEADTANALIGRLKGQGIESIVVLIHEGGLPAGGNGGCDGISGPIIDIVNRLDPEVDLVISGHTHQAYNCLINNKAGQPLRVTSAGQYARMLSNIDLTIDTQTRDVATVAATNINTGTGATTAEDADLKELVEHYAAQVTGPASRVVGQIMDTLSRSTNAAGESLLGDVIADAQLDATDDPGFGDAVIAFMNPGGIRADITHNNGTPGTVDDVTYGEVFTTQPFGNSLVTMTLTGAQLQLLLEQQFTGCTQGYPAGSTSTGQPFNRILQVSNGFSYQWNPAGGACDKVDDASVKLNGVAIDNAISYRVTVNSFLADGGDQFYVLAQGTDRLGGAQDLDALEAYFDAQGVIDPATYPNKLNRIGN
jgi:5'-nucleotidase